VPVTGAPNVIKEEGEVSWNPDPGTGESTGGVDNTAEFDDALREYPARGRRAGSTGLAMPVTGPARAPAIPAGELGHRAGTGDTGTLHRHLHRHRRTVAAVIDEHRSPVTGAKTSSYEHSTAPDRSRRSGRTSTRAPNTTGGRPPTALRT